MRVPIWGHTYTNDHDYVDGNIHFHDYFRECRSESASGATSGGRGLVCLTPFAPLCTCVFIFTYLGVVDLGVNVGKSFIRGVSFHRKEHPKQDQWQMELAYLPTLGVQWGSHIFHMWCWGIIKHDLCEWRLLSWFHCVGRHVWTPSSKANPYVQELWCLLLPNMLMIGTNIRTVVRERIELPWVCIPSSTCFCYCFRAVI